MKIEGWVAFSPKQETPDGTFDWTMNQVTVDFYLINDKHKVQHFIASKSRLQSATLTIEDPPKRKKGSK